jgi:copper chaperone NosL
MGVSEARFAGQVAAPGEVPRFFDDLGCLAAYLDAHRGIPHAAVFVADHRSREWVPAASAVYTRAASVATPMGSHLIAHRDAASRDQDRAAAGGTPAVLATRGGDGGADGSAR